LYTHRAEICGDVHYLFALLNGIFEMTHEHKGFCDLVSRLQVGFGLFFSSNEGLLAFSESFDSVVARN
jgi:hypothetical protein